MKKEYDKVKDSNEVLALNPNDPGANLALGRFLVFCKGAYARGLPLLSRGSDPFLQELAIKDLSDPAGPVVRLALGDSWWNGAVQSKNTRLWPRFRERASYWYAKAWPSLQGLDKERLRTKIRATLRPSDSQVIQIPEGWHDTPGSSNSKGCGLDQAISHSGKYSFKLIPESHYRLGPFPAKKGQKITISAWMFSDGSESNFDGIRICVFGNEPGQGIFGPSIPIDTPFWTYGEASMVLGEQADRFEVRLVFTSKTGRSWVDDISVKCDGVELIKYGSFDNCK
jgi:hypothetical protein